MMNIIEFLGERPGLASLIGASLSAGVGALVALFGLFQSQRLRNKREDYLKKKEKLEQLYIIVGEIRHILRNEVHNLLDLGSISKFDHIRSEYSITLLYDKMEDKVKLAKMITDLYCPEFRSSFVKIDHLCVVFANILTSFVDFVRDHENNSEGLQEILEEFRIWETNITTETKTLLGEVAKKFSAY